MEQQQLTKFQNLLSEEKKRLENELSKFAERSIHNADDFNAQFPNFGDHIDDNAEEVSSYSDYLALEHTLEKDLKDVNSALKRIEEGTYGICRYCQKPIPEKRLEARPSSSACVECKKLLNQEV